MIVITGAMLAKPERIDEALMLSLEHVRRSRKESGCISHAVHRDAENPLRLVFVEEWADMAALSAHFAVPASRAFGKAMGAMASEAPTIKIYEATRIEQ